MFAAGYSINESGQIAGVSRTSSGTALFATLWDGGTPTNLNQPNNANSFAWDINNSGTSVGSSNVSDQLYATTWETDGTATLLPYLPNGDFAQAQGISNSG